MAKRAYRPQAKHWVFTINNYTQEDEERISASLPEMEYLVYGYEIGEKGVPHLQGYVCMKNKKLLSAMSKIFPRAYLEVKRGSVEEAALYCKKGGIFRECGDPPVEQTHNATAAANEIWEDTKAKALENRLDEINAEHYIKYYGTLRKIYRDKMNETIPSDLNWTNGHSPNQWIYGDSGTGKSRKARGENPGFYLKMNNKWWEDYRNEDVVLIEDVGMTHLWMGDFLKIWADRYGFRCELKFGSITLRPRKIVVTSNYHPKEIWPDENVWKPLLRRFQLVEMKGDYTQEEFLQRPITNVNNYEPFHPEDDDLNEERLFDGL